MIRCLDYICKECGKIFDPHGAHYHTSHTPGNHFCVRIEILENYLKPTIHKQVIIYENGKRIIINKN